MMAAKAAMGPTRVTVPAASVGPVIVVASIGMHLGALPERESDEADQE